jgi:hypothetical protein
MAEGEACKMAKSWTLQDHRGYAWEYFKVHAQQRMSLFNFFVVFSSLATTCLVATFPEKTHTHTVGAAIGILLMVISFIFWKLDKRVRFLIKHAESALKWIESTYSLDDCADKSHVLRLFTYEEERTTGEGHLTYAKCFGVTFLAFGLVGLAGLVLSVARIE